MPTRLRVRTMTAEEQRVIAKLARSQTASVRLVQRAKILQLSSEGQRVAQIAQLLAVKESTVRKWFKRFDAQGFAGLEDAPRSGAPSRYTAENKALVLATALTHPRDLELPFDSWTFERLAIYVHEHLGVQLKKTRIFAILHDEGLRWRTHESWFGARLDPEFAQKRGTSRP